MADKFTRLGTVEGDVFYATTVGSSKSIETLEDNIDAKMLAYIGSDTTGGSIGTSITETKIGEVIVPANSANSRFIIVAGVRFENTTSSTAGNSTFRVRTGTSATATANTQRSSISLTHNSVSSVVDVIGGIIMATITTSDESFSGQIYVHVTGQNNASDAAIKSYCDFIYVLGA